MTKLSEFSLQELLQEISDRAIDLKVILGSSNMGIFMLARSVTLDDLDNLEDCEGTSCCDNEVFINVDNFKDSEGVISEKLLNTIKNAKKFGFDLIKAYH